MIKLFRNIRRRLLKENRFSRYLIYAIGEIILVVIGILIALQINEWNNEQNRRNWQHETISQLQTDLEESQKELGEVEKLYLERAQACAKVLRGFWTEKQPYPIDSLEHYLWIPASSRVYSPPLGTANALINSGKIDLLNDPALKTAIITHVEKVDYLLKDVARYEETYYRKGVDLLYAEMPNGMLSLDDIKEQLETRIKMRDTSARVKKQYDQGLLSVPDTIDRVPFQTDVSTIFENRNLFMAYDKLLTAHRNRYYRYSDILESTNELLSLLKQKNIKSK